MEKPVLDKAYDPKAWEGKIYAEWEKSGLFNPEACIKHGVTREDAVPFSVLMPPPNVTGVLHLGHAMENALMDTVARYKRMQGFRTLFLPGVDHAAIATQAKVEKLLVEKEGIQNPRAVLGREKLLERIRSFAEESKSTILKQIRAMGSSCDWSRLAYTFDEKRSHAVNTVFKNMYTDGLIYRGFRVVNWSIKGQSTLSEDEVVHQEATTTLYTFRYAKDFPIPIATTRPETKLGDMAVAVHPDDPRYEQYIGQTFTVDLGAEKPLSIFVFGDDSVDQNFGTGAVGVTPAHSLIDFEMWSRQGKKDLLPVIGTDGCMTVNAGRDYVGLSREDAREKFVEWLRTKNLIEKEEVITHSIATSDRFGDVLEQLPLEQWFVDVNKEIPGRGKSLKNLMRDAVTTGLGGNEKEKISLLPTRFEKTYLQWLDNLRDWCISRQIWWGHRIPIWYCLGCKNEVINPTVKSKWFLVRHGETEFNTKEVIQGHNDSPLTEKGRLQVQLVAEQLKNQDIGLIISSDLGRCKETAGIIAESLNVPVVYDPALRERYYGDAEGLTYDETRERFGNVYASYDVSPGGQIETSKDVEERVAKAFKKIHGTHGNKNVVIVSHGAALRMLVKHIRGLTFEQVLAEIKFKNAQVYSLDTIETPCEKCGGHFFEQDPDTLDTWFSSATWPFSTLGYPDKTEDLKTYLPTSWMQMGNEIFLLWLLRMVLMTTYTMGKIPFREVYMHGMLRDEKGQKFSKSLGNGIDPIDVIHQYGTDALRLALLSGTTPGNDIRFSMEKVEVSRNFINKIWNTGRYVASAVSAESLHSVPEQVLPVSPADHWILSRLQETIGSVTQFLNACNLSLAIESLRDFTWNDFADWYIEIHKIEKNDAVLLFVFNRLLTLWHPFIPFVTEALWSSLFKDDSLPLMAKSWPQGFSDSLSISPEQHDEFLAYRELIIRLRTLRSLYRIDPTTPLDLTLVIERPKDELSLTLIQKLGRTNVLSTTSDRTQPAGSMRIWGGSSLLGFVRLTDIIDIEKEKVRLEKEIESLRHFLESLRKRLANPVFIERAPRGVVLSERQSLVQGEEKLTLFEEALSSLKSIAV